MTGSPTRTAAVVSRPWLTALAAMVAALIFGVIQFRVILTAAPGPFQALRTAFWHDQLGYLSIVTNAASGEVDQLEPVTETGVNHYPRVYYTMVGLFAHLTSAYPVTAWNVVSVILQLAAVVALAIAMSRLSGRWWVGMLAPLPFFAGTLSVATGNSWLTPLAHHAVLWGPYGALFSNNAETAGLSVIVIVMSVLAQAWLRPTRAPVRVGLSLMCAALLGILSGFQTYSFLSGVYVVLFVVAAWFAISGGRWWVTSSVAAILVVIVLGPLVAGRFGQLPTLVFGLLPAVPGLIRGVMRTRGMLALYAAVAAAAAAPQVLWTASGILAGDPFLTYRVASNVDLGVVHPHTVIASLPVVLPFILLLIIAFHRGDRPATAVLIGVGSTAVMLSLNDVWGANAEPYRFWIEMFLLGGVTIALIGAHLAGTPAPARSPDVVDDARHARRRRAAVIAVSVCAVVYVLSLADLVAFNADAGMADTWNPTSARETALADAGRWAASTEPGALIVPDSCIDPRTLKVVSAAPIAYFYLGMAWPEEVDAVSEVMTGRDQGTLTETSMTASDTRWVMTDSACGQPLGVGDATLTLAKSFTYDTATGADTVQLWRYSSP